MIEKIGSVNSYYASNKQIEKTGQVTGLKDSVEISLEAQNKIQQEKIASAKQRLDGYFEDGKIKQQVLNGIVEKIADEILGSSNT